MKISLREFLANGNFGPFTPRLHVGPEAVQILFGEPSEIWPPKDERHGTVQFPLVISYGDVEFHFTSQDELHCLFVDTFHGEDDVPFARESMTLQRVELLRKDTPLEEFLETMKAESIEIRSIRPHMPPHAFIVTTSGGIEVGFEHANSDAVDSTPLLKWFCWTGR